MTDTLQKLDYLTMHLRGFDRRGAAAALHSASATGFTLSGVWKDSADCSRITSHRFEPTSWVPIAARNLSYCGPLT